MRQASFDKKEALKLLSEHASACLTRRKVGMLVASPLAVLLAALGGRFWSKFHETQVEFHTQL